MARGSARALFCLMLAMLLTNGVAMTDATQLLAFSSVVIDDSVRDARRFDCGEKIATSNGYHRFTSTHTSRSLERAPHPKGIYWEVASVWTSDEHPALLPTGLSLQLIDDAGNAYPQIEELTRARTGAENGFRRVPEDASVHLAGSPGQQYRIMYVFDLPVNVPNPTLAMQNERGDIEFTLQLPCKVEDSVAAREGIPNDGIVTNFDETEIIHVGMSKWRITFEQGVEVRTSIANGTALPRRGQFLVIWFVQESQSGSPLPLGNFKLRASSGEGKASPPYTISREGTAALIVTEYDWNPQHMESGLPYRTGIAFDIRPEDTHFELSLHLPSNSPWPTKPVQIVFDA